MYIIDICDSEKINARESVIGIYYPNGIFDETYSERGFSYILDHLLYEELQRSIADAGLGHVQGFTYYGYSCFTVECNPEDITHNLSCIKEILYERELCSYDLEPWILHRRKTSCRRITPLDQLYYAKCLDGNPLAETLSRGIKNVPSYEQLQEWRASYIVPRNIACFISGRKPNKIEVNGDIPFTRSCLPRYRAKFVKIPTHIPWRQSNIIYSVPCSATSESILAAEACCQIVRPATAAVMNQLGGKLRSVQICPDFVPEFRIQLQAVGGSEEEVANRVRATLHEIEVTHNNILKARNLISSYYHALRHNPVAWNRFAGYNVLSGSRYDLNALCEEGTYDLKITPASVLEVLERIRGQNQTSIFVTAVR